MSTIRTTVIALMLGALLVQPGARADAPVVLVDEGPTGGPALGAVPATAPSGQLFDWSARPEGIAGWVTTRGRETVLTDYPFDDHGANIDGDDGISGNPAENYEMLHGAAAAGGAAGDYLYPTADLLGNAADIIEVRLAADDAAWYVLVQFNALIDPERTAIEVKLSDPHTDGPPAILLIHGDTAAMGGTAVETVADADENTFEVRVPFDVFTPTDEMDVVAMAGIWDTATGTWHHPAPDSGALPGFDLAMPALEGPGSYWADRAQSSILASAQAAVPWRVDFHRLRCADCTPTFQPPFGSSVPFVRVFESAQDLGEGVVPQTRYAQSDSFDYRLYRSPYQPYSVYVPPGAASERSPVLFLLHFLGGNHRSFEITSWGNEMKAWADRLGVIVVTPLARGEAGWYEGEAEIDVFEVWRDLARHYDLDSERIYLSGMSMGGYGTWRLGQLYPDLFARAISWSGPPTPYAIWAAPTSLMYPNQNPPACDRDDADCGLTLMDLTGNASNLPYLVVHGGLDELVPFTGIERWMSRYASEQLPHRYVFHPTRRHETSFPATTGEHIMSWLFELPARAQNPAQVRYRIVRDFFQPDFGISYDGAYWLDDMVLAEGAEEGEARAWLHNVTGQHYGPLVGLDALGPYRLSGFDRSSDAASGRFLRLDISDLSAIRVDTHMLAWDPAGSYQLEVSSDRAATLTLVGSFAPDVTVTGAPAAVVDGDIVLEIDQHTTFIDINVEPE